MSAKRLFGTLIAIASVLVASPAARAATVTFDLSGVTGYWSRSTDANAAIPGSPTNGGVCTVGMSTPYAGGCFRYAFDPGSSITVDITGSAVTMIGATLLLSMSTPLVFGTLVLTSGSTTTWSGGATGTLVGDDILWTGLTKVAKPVFDPMDPHGNWISCSGLNCGLLSGLEPEIPDTGERIPLQPFLSVVSNSTPVRAVWLGTWSLNRAHDTIVGSPFIVTAWSNVVEDPNRRQAGFTLGPSYPICMPEPSSAGLVLLGLGALALRSRRA